MFFACHGFVGGTSIVVTAQSFTEAQWQGLVIERRGLFVEDMDQRLETSAVLARLPLGPQEAKLERHERYSYEVERRALKPVYDWKTGKKREFYDGSVYEFVLPARGELEKIWKRPDEPGENGTFELLIRLKRKGQDQPATAKLSCALNWKS